MLRKFAVQAPEAVLAATGRGYARDSFTLGSVSEVVAECAGSSEIGYRMQSGGSWYGSLTRDAACEKAMSGDAAGVAASDALLARLEAMFPAPTARRRMFDDVAGGFPNVPAFVAGTPLTMRRRAKAESEFAPLAIVVDLTTSGGISVEDVRRRGVAILALARALSARRPVELWAGAGLGDKGRGNWVFARLDTAPLDVSRAAFILTSPAMSRGLLYGLLQANGSGGKWPHDSVNACRANFGAILRPAFLHVDEVLAIPGAHMRDGSMADPVAWIGEHVRQYGGADLTEAA